MKKFWLMSISVCILSILAFGCSQAQEDIVVSMARKNSKQTNNGANNENYGTIIPGDGSDTGSGTGTGTGTENAIRLVFAGDVMLAGKVKDVVASNGGGSYQYPFLYVADYLRNADLAFVNLESIVSSDGTSSGSSALRADPAAVSGLTYAGIDVVSVANDHAFDYGRTGFDSSIQNLKNGGITCIGGGNFDESYTAKIIDVKGTRVAFLAFTNLGDEYTVRAQKNDSSQGLTARTGVAWFYKKYVGPALISAKKQADIVIVSLHMGKAGSNLPNLYQDKYAHYCVDQGASIVIGHHPQVIQPVMVYIKGDIAYSLGNLVSDAGTTDTKKGMILEVIVDNKQITQVNRKYVQISSTYQPIMLQ